MASNKYIGSLGEYIACKFLIRLKYKILERNFYFYGGEIDIIAYDTSSRELVFIEVKTRANKRYGSPSEAVGKVKIKHILRGANYYMYIKHYNNCNVRFDIIEVFYRKNIFSVNHIKQII